MAKGDFVVRVDSEYGDIFYLKRKRGYHPAAMLFELCYDARDASILSREDAEQAAMEYARDNDGLSTLVEEV